MAFLGDERRVGIPLGFGARLRTSRQYDPRGRPCWFGRGKGDGGGVTDVV